MLAGMQGDDKLLQWLKEGLSQPGLSQRGLARAIAIDPASVTRMPQGRRKMRPEEGGPIARYLGISPPGGWMRSQRSQLLGIDPIDVSPELRPAVVAKAMEMQIEPTEFVDRAVRAALLICGKS